MAKKLTSEDKLYIKNYSKGMVEHANKLRQANNTDQLLDKINNLSNFMLSSKESKNFNNITEE